MWKVKTFLMDKESNITSYEAVLRIDGAIVHHKSFPAFVDEADTVVIDGAPYERKTPVCEELMRAWIRVQNKYLENYNDVNQYLDQLPAFEEFEKSFDNPIDFVKHMKAELILMK